MTVTLLPGDCLTLLPTLPAQSVDLVLADLPYGTTACAWDSVLPLDVLWREYRRVLKPRGAVVLTGSQPFTSTLVQSNPEWFRCEWIWEKDRGSNFATVKYQPMKEHESVLVFAPQQPTYNPIRIPRNEGGKARAAYVVNPSNTGRREAYNGLTESQVRVMPEDRCPRSIIRFNRETGLHPTQKPVALFAYLIRTYSNPGDLVLDNTAGSGTTGVAAIETGRRAILMERDPAYCAIIERRIAAAQPALPESPAA